MIWPYVFIGGGLGAVLRYGISVMTYKSNSGFPTATFIANLLACLILSLVLISFKDLDPKIKYFIGTGICGGLSTFSTFSLETFDLIQQGQYGICITYILLSLVCCFLIFFGVSAIFNA